MGRNSFKGAKMCVRDRFPRKSPSFFVLVEWKKVMRCLLWFLTSRTHFIPAARGDCPRGWAEEEYGTSGTRTKMLLPGGGQALVVYICI